ncbi:MAG: hypothetical protein NTW69_13755 [Chloroflexi bacterium]|nr:hypothetical protein [Chloroflexota bacterium]
MEHNPRSFKLLSIVLLILPALACQTITKAIMPNPAPPNPLANSGEVSLSMDWLVSTEELSPISTDIGIVEWKSIQDTPGENRVCRSFQGVSWSATPNEGMNCIFKATSGISFDGVIKSMFSDGQFVKGEQAVNSTLSMDGEFAIYAGNFPNGHAVFDLVLLKDNLIYWSSVTLGLPVGETPEGIYKSAPGVIDAFLANVVKINLEKRK